MTPAAHRYRAYLETLTPDTLGRLSDYVTEDVRFKDPFNDVRGPGAMAAVFAHMFDALGQVRFIVHHMAEDGDTCLMNWTFQARLRGRDWAFDGMSAVRFAPDGRVAEHVDHWDAAGAFYARLPVIGWLLERIRARIERLASR